MTQFFLNGTPVSSDAPADTPLLWVVRDEFKLKGAKFGCGKGLCGACTVHIDGAAQRSCVMPLAAVAGKRVTTIEGVGSAEQLHPVQQAWLDESVPQCGYCQPGQIMSACALLAKNPDPDDAAIDAAMQGNICRCGTYPRIRAAIKRAASSVSKSDD